MKKTYKKPLLEWTGDSDHADVQNYMQNHNDNEEDTTLHINHDQAYDMLASDYDYWQTQWEGFTEYLAELMGENTYWIDNATRMGWRSLSGHKVFEAGDGQMFVDKITPNTSDFSLTIWKHYKGFKVRISHHDAPTGEYHVVKPLSEAVYNKLTDNN